MSREEQQRTASARRRNILYLIEKYLIDIGLDSIAINLRKETHHLQPEYEICDNVDLDTIYLEYCSYYHLKFGKYPHVIKNVQQSDKKSINSKRKSARKKQPQKQVTPPVKEKKATLVDAITVLQIPTNSELDTSPSFICRPLEECEHFNPQWKELADIVCRDLVKVDPGLKWTNIYGNTQAVEAIKEAVILPVQYPQFFSELLTPWKAVLLHGPPGSGKTLIAKTLCSETFGQVAFFNVSSSTIVSKWRGESEKIIRVLFEVAAFYSPSIIFIDEVESLTSKRDSSCEHEASRRFKNEFLSLLDGVGTHRKGVFFLANSNLPWEIDPAFLRRFEKKILVQLPSIENRVELMKFFLPEFEKWDKATLQNLAIKCEGFTGDEVRLVMKEAAMNQIRALRAVDSSKSRDKRIQFPTTNSSTPKRLTEKDILRAIEQIKPSGQLLMTKHADWNKKYGNE